MADDLWGQRAPGLKSITGDPLDNGREKKWGDQNRLKIKRNLLERKAALLI